MTEQVIEYKEQKKTGIPWAVYYTWTHWQTLPILLVAIFLIFPYRTTEWFGWLLFTRVRMCEAFGLTFILSTIFIGCLIRYRWAIIEQAKVVLRIGRNGIQGINVVKIAGKIFNGCTIDDLVRLGVTRGRASSIFEKLKDTEVQVLEKEDENKWVEKSIPLLVTVTTDKGKASMVSGDLLKRMDGDEIKKKMISVIRKYT